MQKTAPVPGGTGIRGPDLNCLILFLKVLFAAYSPSAAHSYCSDNALFICEVTDTFSYGTQEGSRKSYTPKKRGRPSHHPLMAFLAEAKMVLHVWLRSGNTGTGRSVVPFLKEAVALLSPGHQIYALRADSGFCHIGEDILCENEGRSYTHFACSINGC